MITNVMQKHFQNLRKLTGLAISLLIGFILLAFSWRAFALQVSLISDDPDIQIAQIEANLPLYDPDDSSVLERVVYFDNSQAGIITTTLAVSGTSSFTVTATPAFDLPATSYNLTSTGMLPIHYQVTGADESQPGVQYTLVNTYGLEATAVISYLRDITQPISTLDNLLPGGFVVTTPDPTLMLTGTVTDDESGVRGVWLEHGTGVPAAATLADTGNLVRNTTWDYVWAIPAFNSGVYTLTYYAEDNIGHREPAHVYTVTVNNHPTAVDDNFHTDKNHPLVVEPLGVLENDDDPRNRELSSILVNPPLNGQLNLQEDGSFVYTPDQNFIGNDTFTYRANNGFNNSDVATVIITVNNDPVAGNDAYETDKNTTLVVTEPGVLGNDEDPRGRELTAVLLTQPSTGVLDFNENGSFIYTPTENFVGEVNFTYKATNGRRDSNPATVTINIKETDNLIYLPVITKPPFMGQGELGFVKTVRFEGITTFRSQLPLDLSGVRFNYTPQDMKIWIGNSEPVGGWIPYSLTPVFDMGANPVIGGQEVHVKFRYWGETITRSTFFFYIPNGDFQDGQVGVSSYWSPQSNGLPWSVNHNRLRLGGDVFGCNNVPFPASATASITLNVPGEGYTLHVNAIVYTYDKLPDPNQAVYDAFEVHAGGQIQRYGYSGPELLNCSTQREVLVNSSTPLSSGNQAVRLENHSRFDSYYNTYTDVIKVWVDG